MSTLQQRALNLAATLFVTALVLDGIDGIMHPRIATPQVALPAPALLPPPSTRSARSEPVDTPPKEVIWKSRDQLVRDSIAWPDDPKPISLSLR